MALKRNAAAAGGDGEGSGKVELCEFAEGHPDLFDFLTLAKWPDGKPRQLGTILVCVEGGLVKGWINDKECGVSCWLSCGSLSGLFKRMDAICGGAEADWRVPRPAGGKRR